MHVYKPPRVGGLDRVPVFTAGTGSTRADLFELDGVTPMPDNVLVADTSGNLPSFQCATSPVYVGVSGSRTTWTPSESGEPSAAYSPLANPSFLTDYVPGSASIGSQSDVDWNPDWVLGNGGDIALVEATPGDGHFNRVLFQTDGIYVVMIDPQVDANTAASKGRVEVTAQALDSDPLNITRLGNNWTRQLLVDGSYGSLATTPFTFQNPGASPPQHFAAGAHLRVTTLSTMSAGSCTLNAGTFLAVTRIA